MATRFEIERFNGRNFSLWKLKIKAILRKDGCLAAISERPTDFTDNNKWNEMDGNAVADLLHLALADEVLSSIEEKNTAKEIWDHLTKLYEAKSLHNKIFLKRKFYKIEPQERDELLLQSLPDSYDQLIINLTNNILTDHLVFDDVAAAVLEEENRRKNKEDRQGNLQQAEALTGHLKKDCWSLPKNSNPQGNIANTSDDGDVLCCEASTTMEGRKRFADIWLIDSRATYHMTSRREWFHNYEPISGGSVYSCNDHALEIVGVGTIKLKMYDGTIKIVRDVRHVKGLKKNLLSYGLLDNSASKIETRKGIMKVFHGALVVMKGEKIAANLYMLKGETLQEAEASVASCSSDSAMLWHQKLGHMSKQGMKVLVEKKLLPGLTKVSLPLCENCITKDKLQREEENDSTVKEKAEATQIQVERELEQRDSFEAEPAHEEPEPENSEAPTTRQSDRVRRRPNWHSDYVMEGNVPYCLLTEDVAILLDSVTVFRNNSSFLDPKGRGGSTDYDNAVALPAGGRGDEEELAKEKNKSAASSSGKITLSVTKSKPETGEVIGVFESLQPSDTDLGAKTPKDVKITGIWYAQLDS
ncbi:hypothetical protein V6N12_038144 [Hibiscus sabdariffa]|uniref:GAG-pre-integrase domain-containing protein n=1 Tax=Hibiscus sabdariffa TaxID=183260 RepID=A0ABR2BWX4_9ROSI